MSGPVKDWGKGIPHYTKDDLMTEQDVYEFAVETLLDNVLIDKYELISANRNRSSFPSLVMKKDNKLCFILVDADTYPNKPKINDYQRFILLKQAKKFNALSYYASFGFGACDAERFDAHLALKNDAYYAAFEGLEEVKEINDFTSNYYFFKILDSVGIGYVKCDYNYFKELISDDCTWYSPYSESHYYNKNEITKYYNEKFPNCKNTKIEYQLCWATKEHIPMLLLGQQISLEKHGLLIKIKINDDGLINSIELMDPDNTPLYFNR